ncbi:MAG TPA: hypothetical protein VI306_17820 [Pyrinomonadaceae bacterium]
MKYETPEIFELGMAEEVVLGSAKPRTDDDNGTGVMLEYVDEDIQ